MATFQNTVTIRRPIEDVFGYLADFENIPAWNYAILQTSKTSPGPVGVGTTYRQIRSLPGRSEEGFAVTVFEPTSRLEIHGEIGPFTATISYLLVPIGDATCLTNTVDLQPASGALRLLAPLAASRVKTAVAANLDALRQLLERGRRDERSRPAVGGQGYRGLTRSPACVRGTVTTLENRPTTGLLVIDVQNGVVAGAHQRDAVVANVGSLVDKARSEHVPVVWVQR